MCLEPVAENRPCPRRFPPRQDAHLRAVIVALHLLCWAGRPASAEEIQVTPFFGLRQEYNDNIFFSAIDPIRDAITIASPGIRLGRRTERLDAGLSGRLDQRYYREYSELDHLDKDITGQVNYRLSERFELGADAGYSQTSSADRDVIATGLVVGANIRDRTTAGCSGSARISEISSLSAAYHIVQDDWDNPRLNDSMGHIVSVGVARALDRHIAATTGRFNFSGQYYQYASEYTPAGFSSTVSQRTRLYFASVTAGIEKQLSETWQLSLQVGPAYADTRESTRVISETIRADAGWGGVFNAGVKYAGEKNRFEVNGAHDIGAPSASIGVTTRTTLSALVSRQFSHEWQASLLTRYFINRADNKNLLSPDTDQETLTIQPRARYGLTDDIFLEAVYSYSVIKNNITHTSAGRNYVFAGITWQWPLIDR
ncbi:MAG: hypothetical protein ABIL58_21400 [Pseudomonadota bacterium]